MRSGRGKVRPMSLGAQGRGSGRWCQVVWLRRCSEQDSRRLACNDRHAGVKSGAAGGAGEAHAAPRARPPVGDALATLRANLSLDLTA